MHAAPIDLLCLPCAGASATMYLRWRRHLPAWLRVVPVELPGRGLRLAEPPVEDFDRLLDLLCEEQAARPPGRRALFGHSMGALLAHGMARRLGASALFVAACAAPTQRDPQRFPAGDDDASLLADLKRQGGTPQEVLDHPELLALALQTLRADYRVCASYRPLPSLPLGLPVHVLAGREDRIAPAGLQAWRREAGGVFTLQWFTGGHFFIREQEERVLQALVDELLRDDRCAAGRASVANG
ncbi:thioesterase II family protein [Eleftheria terrae]|uniref:thioesterase II family protein n=1 Tax=Eleftheria terrae TaxID=1597781 RepID=UPI00263B511B|nr:alpha/beta fold hydrolase [Eleftheria terrae]WKB55460.1 alpha/beta fold hydrolase [Eleftheria terrae]